MSVRRSLICASLKKRTLAGKPRKGYVIIYQSYIASFPEGLLRPYCLCRSGSTNAAMSASGCHPQPRTGFRLSLRIFSLAFTSCFRFGSDSSFSFWLYYCIIYFVCQHFFNNFVKKFFILSFFRICPVFPAQILHHFAGNNQPGHRGHKGC